MISEQLIFPDYKATVDSEFVRLINRSGEKWIIFTNDQQEPKLVVDADGFIRSILLKDKHKNSIEDFCHFPLIIKDESTDLGIILKMLKRDVEKNSETPIDLDVVLYWTERERRIITGADLFGRLLKGI